MRLSTILLCSVTVVLLLAGTLSCRSSVVKSMPDRYKNQEGNFRWMLANEYHIDTSRIILEHQHDWFESVLLLETSNDVQGFVVQTIRKYRKTKNHGPPEFKLQHAVFGLHDSTVNELIAIVDQLSIDSLIDQDNIEAYKHGYLDCTRDILSVAVADNKMYKVGYHCLAPQDTTAEAIRYAQRTMSSIIGAVNYRQYYDRLLANLEPGQRYNRGMVDIYKSTEKQMQEWKENYPKREYQAEHSDSITNLLSTDLNGLWAQRQEEYRSQTEDYCYESFDVYFLRAEGVWIVLPPGQTTEVDKDYRRCRKRLRTLLKSYDPKYRLLFDELRTVYVYADSIEVEDNTHYGILK